MFGGNKSAVVGFLGFSKVRPADAMRGNPRFRCSPSCMLIEQKEPTILGVPLPVCMFLFVITACATCITGTAWTTFPPCAALHQLQQDVRMPELTSVARAAQWAASSQGRRTSSRCARAICGCLVLCHLNTPFVSQVNVNPVGTAARPVDEEEDTKGYDWRTPEVSPCV